MGELKGITINTDPAAEAHIYAEDDAAIYQSIVGSDGVMMIGQQCESQVISNNKVRVKDGVIVVGGHFARIPYGDYIDCEIANGQSGRNRNDIIIAKFVTTGTGGIDTYTLEVKQGASTTGSATDPALTQNNLYESGKIREMPLYRVKIEGLSITKVEKMFESVPTIPMLNTYLSEISSDFTKMKNYIVEEGSNSNGKYRKWSDGTLEMWFNSPFTCAIGTKAGSIYTSGQFTLNFPVASKTKCNIVLTIGAGGAIWGKVYGSANGYKSSFSYHLLSAVTWNVASFDLSYYARGTWK